MGEPDVELNVDQFIKAIHIRSILWNPKHRNYATEYKRNQAWKEICIALDKNFNNQSQEQQKQFDSTIRQNFETFKDSFRREKYCLNYENMVGGRNFKRKIFIHYDKLKFLNASITNNEDAEPTEAKRSSPQPTENSPPSKKVPNSVKVSEKQNKTIEPYDKLHFLNASITNNEDADPTETKCSSPQPTENSQPSKKVPNSVKVSEKQNKTSEVMNEQTHIPTLLPSPASDPNQNDEDTLFLLSLVTEIKKIPQDHRLSARIDILQTIRRWQTNHSQQICSLSPIRSVPSKDPTIAEEKDSPKLHKLFVCDICCRKYTTREELKAHKMLHKKERYGNLAEKKLVEDISMDVTFDCDELEIALKEESCDSNDSLNM